jgi:Domain of unknown function (DUF4440)
MKPKKQKQGVSLVRLRLSKTIRKVMSLEKEVWRAAKEKDARAFAKLVPADALMIFQSGKMTQPDYLATMKDRVLEENSIEDLQGYMPNPSTVILTYKTIREGSYKGMPFPGSRVIESTTWIKRQNRWVAILNQETPLQN